MASTATDINHADTDDAIRPRTRHASARRHDRPSASAAAAAVESTVPTPDSTASPATSGRSTPLPENAPPSAKSLSTARKHLRAEQQQVVAAIPCPPPPTTKNTLHHPHHHRRRRLFPTTEFASRLSHFDPDSDHRDFHGFFNLFWIGLAIMGITTMLRHMKDTGYPFSFAIWSLFTVKLWHLAVADFFMVASTALSLPLHRHLFRPSSLSSSSSSSSSAGSGFGAGLWSWRRGGHVVQSVFQLVWLAAWVHLPYLLEWTWTSQVFFLLHTMVLLMKMHSYAFYNGHLSETETRLRRLDAPAARGTPARDPPYIYPVAAETRRSSKAGIDVDATQGGEANIQAAAGGGSGGGHSGGGADSDSEVDTLRETLARELTSPMGNVTYPANLTWANYLDFLFCPTLCYELEYPRTRAVNWTSLVSKIVAVFGCIFLLTITSEDFILPVLDDAQARLTAISSAATAASSASLPPLAETLLVLAETISWLLFPFMLTFLLVFLVIFEYLLGAMAELTRFADRRFYADWWNSTDWMAFSRQWNVPVHAFLRRHVYSASRPFAGRAGATALTFLVSAVGHEIVMGCITKKLRGYGFVCQMLQLPIVALQRTSWVRGRRTLNNVCFWCSMILGLSLICALYVLI